MTIMAFSFTSAASASSKLWLLEPVSFCLEFGQERWDVLTPSVTSLNACKNTARNLQIMSTAIVVLLALSSHVFYVR